jgi:hypothetical protein
MFLCILMSGFSSAMLLPVMIGTGGLLLSACKPGNDYETDLWDMEMDAVEISKDIKLLGYRLSLQEPAYGELVALKSGMVKMKAKKQVLLADQIRLQSEVDALEVDHEKMTTRFIKSRRSEIIGTRIDELVVAAGRVYRNVKIIDIGDAGVDFRHEGGSTRLRYNELSEAQRDYFGLNPASARIALMTEAMNQKAYEEWVSASIEKDLYESQVRAHSPNCRFEKTPPTHLLHRNRPSFVQSPLSQPATPFGIRRWPQWGTTENFLGPFDTRRSLPSY